MASPAGSGPRPLQRFERRFTAGEVIYDAGQPATLAFMLEEGRVQILRRSGRAETPRDVAAGELFGEEALLPNAARRSAAIALTDGMALELDAATLEIVLSNPAV